MEKWEIALEKIADVFEIFTLAKVAEQFLALKYELSANNLLEMAKRKIQDMDD